jgi:hypothetical protein
MPIRMISGEVYGPCDLSNFTATRPEKEQVLKSRRVEAGTRGSSSSSKMQKLMKIKLSIR